MKFGFDWRFWRRRSLKMMDDDGQFNMKVNMIGISSPLNCLDSDNCMAYDAMLRKQSFDKAYNSEYLHSIRGSITITSLNQPFTSRVRARERE